MIADGSDVDDSSYLGKLFRETVGKTPQEIADYLEKDEELEDTHESAAQAGQSEVSPGCTHQLLPVH